MSGRIIDRNYSSYSTSKYNDKDRSALALSLRKMRQAPYMSIKYRLCYNGTDFMLPASSAIQAQQVNLHYGNR